MNSILSVSFFLTILCSFSFSHAGQTQPCDRDTVYSVTLSGCRPYGFKSWSWSIVQGLGDAQSAALLAATELLRRELGSDLNKYNDVTFFDTTSVNSGLRAKCQRQGDSTIYTIEGLQPLVTLKLAKPNTRDWEQSFTVKTANFADTVLCTLEAR